MNRITPIMIALSFGAYISSTAHATLSIVGATPSFTFFLFAAIAATCAIVHLVGQHVFTARRTRPWLLLCVMVVLLADPLLQFMAQMPFLPEVNLQLFGVLWLLASIPYFHRVDRFVATKATTASLPFVGVGALIGLLPPQMGIAIAMLLVAIPNTPAPSKPAKLSLGLIEVVNVVLAAVALGTLWLSLRAALDPTFQGMVMLLVALPVGIGIGRAISISLHWPRMLACGLALLGVWTGWGVIWVNSETVLGNGQQGLIVANLAMGMAGGLLMGWGWGRSPAPLVGFGIALAMMILSLWQGSTTAGPMLVLVLSSLALLLAKHPGTRFSGAVLIAAAGGALFIARSPVADLAVEGRFTQYRTADGQARSAALRSGLQQLEAKWGVWGLSVLRKPETLRDMDPSTASRFHIEIDGLVAELPSRANAADALAGHLAGAFTPETGQMLVLGDDLGSAVKEAVRYTPGQIRVSTPFPSLVRTIADMSNARQQAWLQPMVQLEPIHPEALLRLTTSTDTVLEIVRAPWADSSRGLLNSAHINAVERRLTGDGVYVLVLHTLWFDAQQPEAIVSAVADRFEHMQLWLPPNGADTLIVVASKQPLSLQSLVQRIDVAGASRLQSLNLNGALAMASLAVASKTEAQQWAGQARQHFTAGLSLPDATWKRPILHLQQLSAHMTPVQSMWADINETQLTELNAHRQTRELLLSLLGRASSGDIQGVFEDALSMQNTRDGVAALDPLIEPHLRDARRAIERAKQDGLDSPEWDNALRYVTTAQMLSPQSPRPYLALGEIAMGQRDINAAEQHYQQALEKGPGELQTLTALAHIAHIRGDRIEEEQLLREAITENADQWQAHQNLGSMLLYVGRYDEAQKAIEEATALSQGLEEAPLLAMAEIFLSTGQPTRALVEAERATQIGGSGQSWFLRGRAHYDLEQIDLAADDYQRAVLEDPQHALAHAALGHIRFQQGLLEEAAEALQHSLVINPSNNAARDLLQQVAAQLRTAEENAAP